MTIAECPECCAPDGDYNHTDEEDDNIIYYSCGECGNEWWQYNDTGKIGGSLVSQK